MQRKQDAPVRLGGLFQTELSDKQRANSRLNLEEYDQRATTLTAFPRRIVLELTNMCNYRCIMCGREAASERPSYLDPAVLAGLSEVLEHTEEVCLLGWGEPTIHPEFKEILRSLSRFPSLRVYLLTNGSSLGRLRGMVERGWIHILAISLDGATAATNDKIRRGSSLEQILDGVRELGAARDASGGVPYMNFVFTMMRRNVRELPGLVRLAHEVGVPEVKVVYFTSFARGLDRETFWGAEDLCREHMARATELGAELGVSVRLPPLIGEDPAGAVRHKPCDQPWRDLFVGADMSLRPCQSTVTRLGVLDPAGLSAPADFWSVWNSQAYQDFRKNIDDEALMDAQCRQCFQSSHANWNNKFAHIQSFVSACAEQ